MTDAEKRKFLRDEAKRIEAELDELLGHPGCSGRTAVAVILVAAAVAVAFFWWHP